MFHTFYGLNHGRRIMITYFPGTCEQENSASSAAKFSYLRAFWIIIDLDSSLSLKSQLNDLTSARTKQNTNAFLYIIKHRILFTDTKILKNQDFVKTTITDYRFQFAEFSFGDSTFLVLYIIYFWSWFYLNIICLVVHSY